MKIIPIGLEGLFLIEPQAFADDRGVFYESWRKENYKKIGIKEDFIQDNVSISKKNVLRGLHFQKNQGQLVTVTHGKIFDVAVDVRSNSSTYGKYFSIELSADNPLQLYMTPGFAHGFCVLSDMAVINYKCNQYYNPQEEGGILWNDQSIGIDWPVGHPVISQKDQSFGPLGHI